MARGRDRMDVWRQMKPAARMRSALAAFLLFSVIGLVSILMVSSLRVFPWPVAVAQTFASGAMAASIVLAVGRKWWTTLLIVFFWMTVMFYVGGGLSITADERGDFRVRLEGPDRGSFERSEPDRLPNASELQALYVQRGVLGGAVIVFLVFGYVALISVVRGEVRRRSELETEVRIAQGIQQSLLPARSIEAPQYAVAGITLPASEVGGDYHDFVEMEGGRLAVAIADVTGHGVGAGILSAMTKSAFRTQLAHDPAPAALLTSLNRTLFDLSDKRTFVTFAYALIDPARRIVDIATAGHPPILYRSEAGGGLREIRSKSPALGMKREVRFEDWTSVQYGPGDTLLFYTDGILEARNPQGEEFGDERLCAAFAAAGGTPQQVLEGILAALGRYAGARAGYDDDISAVCARFIA